MRELQRRGIHCPAPGGDENSQYSDQLKGTDAFVCLCFTQNHPMAYVARRDRGLDTVYLRINPNIILHPGVMLTLEPSNKTGVERIPVEDGLDQIDLEVTYQRTNWSDPAVQDRLRAAEKYELLIPTAVSRTFLMDLHG